LPLRGITGTGSEVNPFGSRGQVLGSRGQVLDPSAETVNYSYNIRNWMTGISSTNFSESLSYNNSPNPKYNGNISRLTWTTLGTIRGYDLVYDPLDRLTSATYGETGSLQTNRNRYSTTYTYDKNGNILTLSRRGLRDGGSYGLVDNLTFTYSGNQVTRIEDSSNDPTYNGAFNFVDGASQTNEYTYDANGNMTKDLNKNILSIQYNLLNLPQNMSFGNGNTAEYAYNAAGERLSASYGNLTSGVTFYYSANYFYTYGSISNILIDGGYITLNGSTPIYHYYLKDHLGSNRVVCNASGSVEQVNHYYPFGGLFGESTNASTQKYKYNGKELDRVHGLDWYDYGARFMDGMRFTTIDPMAEKYYDISPYAYCANNPIYYIDPDGKKKHNWIKGIGRYNNASSQKRYENRYGNRFVQIWAHGHKESVRGKAIGIEVEIDYYSPRIRGGGYYHSRSRESKIVKSASELDKILKKYDRDWSTTNSEQPILILHSCATSELALEMSGSKEFQDVIIIAPTENVHTSTDGDERIATTVNEETGEEIEGQWEVFMNGKHLLDKSGNPITYPSNSQVGTKGFEYGF